MPTTTQLRGKLKFYSKPYGRQWKWRYQQKGVFIEPRLKIPDGLKDKNLNIIDPLHLPKPEYPKWIPPRMNPMLGHFFDKPSIEQHPDYHNMHAWVYDRNVKLHAGIDQACLLTKTMPIRGMPDIMKSNALKYPIINESTNMEMYIKQALAFNASKDKCPIVPIKHDVKFRMDREFATTNTEQMYILCENMMQLCNMSIGDSQKLLARKLLKNSLFHLNYARTDEPIHIRCKTNFILYTKQPQGQLADQAMIDKTKDHKFINMYPIYPTIDLVKEHVYRNDSCIGWKNNSHDFANVHTVVHTNDDDFSTEADVARSIMYAFGYAYAQAQVNKEKSLSTNSLDLKKPIVVNLVSMCNGRLNYVSYQLNTLDMRNNAGIKNIAFIDDDNQLYLNSPDYAKLPYASKKNVQRYALDHLKYNDVAFAKFKALFLNDS